MAMQYAKAFSGIRYVIAGVLLCAGISSLPDRCYAVVRHSNSQPASEAGSGTTNRSLRVVIEPVFNGVHLKLESERYVNEHGDTLTVDLFRFYMTKVNLHTASGKDIAVKDALLFDAEDTATWCFRTELNGSEDFESISFVAGVDSATNTNGANGGDLDPAKGMYWAWNTGYIMAKIEGKSAVCKTLHHAYEFHVGGYMPPYNTARNVRLVLKNKIVAGSSEVVIKIKADVAPWMSGKLDLAKTNSIVIPGKEASAMADRYAKMFSCE